MSTGLSQGKYRFESLTQTNVISEIEDAKKAVTFELEKLGIDTSKLNFHCQIKPVFEEDMTLDIDSDSDSDFEELDEAIAADFFDEEEEEEEIQEDINFLSGILIFSKYKFLHTIISYNF